MRLTMCAVVAILVGGVEGSASAQPAEAEVLEGWRTATLVRLLGLVELELARRGADLEALRLSAVPSTPAESGPQAIRTVEVEAAAVARRRSRARTWGGVGMMVGGLALVRHVNDRRSGFLRSGLPRYPYVGAWTAAGLGVSAVGALLATRWADIPVAASAEFNGGRVAVGGAVAW